VNKEALSIEISNYEKLDKDLYTNDSWVNYEEVVNKAKVDFERTDIQQIEVDNLLEELNAAKDG